MKIGFIGTGNMGGALASAAAKSAQAELLLANRTPEKAQALAEAIGARVCDNAAAAGEADHLFLGVKPQMLPALLDELRPALLERTDRFILVSMAAGVKTGTIRQALGFDCPVVRIMPNLPVARVMWRAMPDLTTGVECWITAGGAHHTAFTYDLTAEQMGDWAAAMGIEAVYIDKDTKIRDFKRDLMLGEVFYR